MSNKTELASADSFALELQANATCVDKTAHFGAVMLTPAIDEAYWLFRVPVSDKQAVVAFPKFGLIGIGFQHEDDWNTNLPADEDTVRIFRHISHNKGDASIPDERCIAAIRMLQDAATKYSSGDHS